MVVADETVMVDGELTAQVATKYRREVRQFRLGMFDDAAEFQAATLKEWNLPTVYVRSVTDRFMKVSVILSHLSFEKSYPTELDDPEAVEIHLSVGAHHKELRTAMKVPPAEAVAWAAAVFGPWASSAYWLGAVVENSIGRPPALHFALYVSGKGEPRHPPAIELIHKKLVLS
ncbi:UNVERIFIED_ORG: hypothetical protein FNL38_1115 [Nocardia globerula]|uniref:Uncharacterized protein n=2 Tax=Nocardiaceae TaxID=85025 RepID=A0A652YHS3_NOCGL|nr:hypothetical protein [Nocardia globerula]